MVIVAKNLHTVYNLCSGLSCEANPSLDDFFKFLGSQDIELSR